MTPEPTRTDEELAEIEAKWASPSSVVEWGEAARIVPSLIAALRAERAEATEAKLARADLAVEWAASRAEVERSWRSLDQIETALGRAGIAITAPITEAIEDLVAEVKRQRKEAQEDYARAEEAEAQVIALRFTVAGQANRPPTAAGVTRMVDETAKSIMRGQGRDPEGWDSLSPATRDEMRLLALDRLRKLP
jgi:hypothetical protein